MSTRGEHRRPRGLFVRCARCGVRIHRDATVFSRFTNRSYCSTAAAQDACTRRIREQLEFEAAHYNGSPQGSLLAGEH